MEETLGQQPSPTIAEKKTPARDALLAGMAIGLLSALLMLLAATFARERLGGVLAATDHAGGRGVVDLRSLRREVTRLQSEVTWMRRRLERLTPVDPYLIVNTSDNKIYLIKGKKLLREGLCSSGSYVLLKAANDQQWVFQTPRGRFRVLAKQEAPVWRMPDWAFIEEGLPVPPPNATERFEYGVLGEYALAFGNGYLIHGTLYKRLMGMPVTHGCVRLDDEDLRAVYHNLQIGSKIFIY